MSANKIQAIERLRLKKDRLKVEEQRHIRNLDKHFSYLQQNYGSLLLDAGWTAIRSRFPSTLHALLPVIYQGLKPVIISFAWKKAKKLIFKG